MNNGKKKWWISRYGWKYESADETGTEDAETDGEDLIVAATNEALRKMEEDSQEKMGKVTGGLGGMGGGFPF